MKYKKITLVRHFHFSNRWGLTSPMKVNMQPFDLPWGWLGRLSWWNLTSPSSKRVKALGIPCAVRRRKESSFRARGEAEGVLLPWRSATIWALMTDVEKLSCIKKCIYVNLRNRESRKMRAKKWEWPHCLMKQWWDCHAYQQWRTGNLYLKVNIQMPVHCISMY